MQAPVVEVDNVRWQFDLLGLWIFRLLKYDCLPLVKLRCLTFLFFDLCDDFLAFLERIFVPIFHIDDFKRLSHGFFQESSLYLKRFQRVPTSMELLLQLFFSVEAFITQVWLCGHLTLCIDYLLRLCQLVRSLEGRVRLLFGKKIVQLFISHTDGLVVACASELGVLCAFSFFYHYALLRGLENNRASHLLSGAAFFEL